MPTMYEIYENHSTEYDELIKYEDYKRNLPATLNRLFDFSEKTVIEFGTGTGRLTGIFAKNAGSIFCFDRSEHMLAKAESNLRDYKEKIQYGICDNNRISTVSKKGDFVMEGWSFGHTIMDNEKSVNKKTDELVSHSMSLLKEGGTVIFVETLGTDTVRAVAPNNSLRDFYRRLEDFHKFSRVEVSTDYSFPTVAEAERIAGFFFGPETGLSIKEKGSPILREFTGLWYKTK